MEKGKKEGGLSISVKSFAVALIVIFSLMILTYVLTMVLSGEIPFWKWILSPVLVLGAKGNATIIAVIVFLLVLGGVFNALGEYGLMKYMLTKISWKYGTNRYTLQAIVIFFFMAMGAMIGSFEECVPLVPIVVALAVSLGWDKITGIAMSLLAVGCGFASGVCNPFTVGIAQELSGLPMFSGIWLRLVSFVLIYLLLFTVIRWHSKKVEKSIASLGTEEFTANVAMDKGLICFATILATGVLIVLSSSFLTFLQDFTMIIVAVMFLVAGITSSLVSGMKGKELGESFVRGVSSMLPAILMILMAASIKYTLDTAGVLDSILQGAVNVAQTMPRWAVILFIYLIVLVMNMFIASGSAKAFMLIPLIVPLAQQFGISAQLCILAFAFGDGFSNVLYPTNPVLLISLGLADVSYGQWFKWSIKIQLVNLLLTSGLLIFGLAVGY